jgi:hypothetical protein
MIFVKTISNASNIGRKIDKKTWSVHCNGASVMKLTTINKNSMEQFLLYLPFHEYQTSY